MDLKENKRFLLVLSIVSLLLIIGTLGYSFLLNVTWVDALYMTVITISTVGYTEVGEMTDGAKMFSIFIIFVGLGSLGYVLSKGASLLMDGAFKETWRLRKMEKEIAKIKDHYILCGAGETGHSVIQQFKERKVPFVVIEENEKKVKELLSENVLVVQGDATQETSLEKAQISSAKGLISALSDDSSNVFTVLTARQLNQDLYIVSRAVERSSIEKLKKAGANNTISPNEIGGIRMASYVLRPSIISFLDIITRAGDVILDLEDVIICKDSALRGKTLREAKIPDRTGLIVLSLKKHGKNNPLLNPNSDEVLEVGDTMIVLGQKKQVNQLRTLSCDDGTRDPTSSS